MNFVDGPSGGTPLTAANLNKLAVVADIGTAGTDTGDALRAALVSRGGQTVTGTSPYVEFDVDGGAAAIHIVATANYSAPYLLGLGVNAPNSKGGVYDVNAPGAVGGQFNLFTGDDANARALQVQANSGSKGVALSVDTYSATGTAINVHANGTPAAGQLLLHVQTDALASRGGFATEILQVYADTGNVDFTGPLVRVNGGMFTVQDSDPGATGNVHRVNVHGTTAPALELHNFTGTDGLWFSTRAVGKGQTASLQGIDGASAIGSETWIDVLQWGVASGGAPQLGFFGVAPVGRPLLATGAAHTVDDVITVLQSLGLARQS